MIYLSPDKDLIHKTCKLSYVNWSVRSNIFTNIFQPEGEIPVGPGGKCFFNITQELITGGGARGHKIIICKMFIQEVLFVPR